MLSRHLKQIPLFTYLRILLRQAKLQQFYQSQLMKQEQKYVLPTGIETNEQQLRTLQKQLLKSQQEKILQERTRYGPPLKITHDRSVSAFENHANPQNLQQLHSMHVSMVAERKKMLAQQLQSQILTKEAKRRQEMELQLEMDKFTNQRTREIMDRELHESRTYRQQMQREMSHDYIEKIRRNQQRMLKDMEEKKLGLRAQQVQSTLGFAKGPAVQDQYQTDFPYKSEAKYSKIQQIINRRIQQTRQKQQKLAQIQKTRKLQQKNELQRVLQQQIKQKDRQKQQLLAYDKERFYRNHPQNMYHPIYNPIDSRFAKDNKYIMNELISVAKDVQGGPMEGESQLARKGSRSLL